MNSENNFNDKNLAFKLKNKINKKLWFVILSILLLAIILIVILSHKNDTNDLVSANKQDKVNLYSTLIDSSDLLYNSINPYFIYNDKIYYYKYESYNNSEKQIDKFFSANFDGTENKQIVSSNELRLADFYFVYDNEAYYHTTFYDENKKINLKTGKITTLDYDDIFIAKTLDDGIVYTYKYDFNSGNKILFKKIDLKTGNVIKQNEANTLSDYFLDYVGVNVYYLGDTSKNSLPVIYRNSDIVYKFDEPRAKDFAFVAIDENYLYFKNDNYIYKLDVESKEILNKTFCDLGKIHRLSSGNNVDNYFYAYESIYEFDLNIGDFKLLTSEIMNNVDSVYKKDDKLIFTYASERYDDNYSNSDTGRVYVFDTNNNSVSTYDNVHRVSIFDKYMYLEYVKDKKFMVFKENL